MKQNKKNEYDEIRSMLKLMRNFNKDYHNFINEQETPIPYDQLNNNNDYQDNDDDNVSNTEDKDITVVNNVEIVMNSSDEMDLQLNDEEKGKVSQIIDDFRSEISELVDFGKLQIYNNSAKLDGILNQFNLNFVLSAGDDQGVFISNTSLLKITKEILEILSRLEDFSYKFHNTIGDLISNRKQN